MDGAISTCKLCAAASVLVGKSMLVLPGWSCAITPELLMVRGTPIGSTGKVSSRASDSSFVRAFASRRAVPICDAFTRQSAVPSPLLGTVTDCEAPLIGSRPLMSSDSCTCLAWSR